MPALLPFYPSRAANILRYRYNSLDESNKIARVFGYNGSMFAWTAYVFIINKIIIKNFFSSSSYLGRPEVKKKLKILFYSIIYLRVVVMVKVVGNFVLNNI